MAIMLVAIFSSIIVLYSKKAGFFKDLISRQKENTFQNIELQVESRSFPAAFATQLDNYLAKDNIAVVEGDPQTDINAWIQSVVETNYNSDTKNLAAGRRIEVKCLYQENPDAGTIVREPCTIYRFHEPKTFQVTLTQSNPNSHTLGRIVEQIQMERATLNQFMYAVKNSSTDMNFGRVPFSGPVALYFANPLTANIWFWASTGGGTVFKSNLITNLTGSQQIQDAVYLAKHSFQKIKFQDNGDDLRDVITGNYVNLPPNPTTINFIDKNDENRTLKMQQMLHACRLKYPSHPEKCSVATIESTFEFSDCNLTLREGTKWTYTDGSTVDTCDTGTLPANCRTIENNVVIDDIAFTGAQRKGLYYLPPISAGYAFAGNTFIKEVVAGQSAPGKKSKLCASMTFLGKSLVLQNSIVKAARDLNSGLFAGGSITFSDANPTLSPGKEFILDDGSASGVSLYTLKQQARSIPTNQVSIDLQISLVAGGEDVAGSVSTGSVSLPDVFFSSSPTITLGTFNIAGLVVTAEPLATSRYYNGTLTGFQILNMSQGDLLAENPPPNFDIPLKSGITPTVMSSSTSNLSIQDAITALSNR